MKFSMTGQEKMWPLNTGDCLIEVTTWTGVTVFSIWESFYRLLSFVLSLLQKEKFGEFDLNIELVFPIVYESTSINLF